MPADASDAVRVRRGRVTVHLGPIGVQARTAADALGVSVEVLLCVPFTELPYRRTGTHRWYLVRHLNAFAERMMAEQIAHGTPPERAAFGARVFA